MSINNQKINDIISLWYVKGLCLHVAGSISVLILPLEVTTPSPEDHLSLVHSF